MSEKIKILMIADHPLAPSGVGTQTKYVCEALLKTGKFQIINLGGAVKHHDYKPQMIEGYDEQWKVYPVDGYGNPDIIRSIIRTERPDLLWFMTDPRFFEWLWLIESEIRPLLPMIYYHVWDNYPFPHFNKGFYDSTDLIVSISKVTDEIVRNVSPDVDCIYHPHSVDSSIFRPISAMDVQKFRDENMEKMKGKFIFFWNNRNARRKQSGSVIWWFNEFLNKVGREKASLIMHTDSKDPNGQDLDAIIRHLDLNNGQVFLSRQKIAPEHLSMLYNAVDCTINIADAEGFGLSTLESLSCGTPIIVNMTGGLQEQVTNGKDFFGIPIFPSSKSIIGSQNVPYIYEDRVDQNQVISAFTKMYQTSQSMRDEMGEKGRQHVLENYNFEKYKDKWAEIILNAHEKYGSWENRKGYIGTRFGEIV